MQRCAWAKGDLMTAYHDQEWGVPLRNEQRLFEFLCLEGAQAGLSWEIILKKRAAYRVAFDNFDPGQVAAYDVAKTQSLLANAGIVRNRLKIAATIGNARAFLAVQQEFGSFATYIWRFVGGQPQCNHWPTLQDIPTQTPAAVTMSKDLQHRGFRFVGPTICYAFMQATGMVNDHLTTCFRHSEIAHAITSERTLALTGN